MARRARSGGGSQSDHVYVAIKAKILAREIEPGERLVEAQLAEELGISRTPVREALGRLAGEHIVMRDTSGSHVVRVPTQREVEEIYLIREMLEGLAARLAAQRMSESEMIFAEATVTHLRESAQRDNTAAVNKTNIQFHASIYEATGNERLQRMGRDLLDFVQLFSYRPMEAGARGEEIADEHRAILDAIRSQDPADAERTARSHVASARDMTIRALAASQLA
jgi:DNA-binding GntR family transcriptional regulator